MVPYLLCLLLIVELRSIKYNNEVHKYSGPTFESLQNFTWHLKDVFNLPRIDSFFPANIDLDKEVDLYIFTRGHPLQWYTINKDKQHKRI